MLDFIPLDKVPYFSDFFRDYINEKKEISDLYNRFPHIENFEKQIQEKQQNFCNKHREILKKTIENQYHTSKTQISNLTKENLEKLSSPNTFTITTGHQLSLFTGELYFIYKIVSTIKLTQILAKTHPKYHFIPVYWQASEDHDFQEINHININEKKILWHTNQTGMVGNFSTQGINLVINELEKELGKSIYAQKLCQLFRESYLKRNNLSEATRHLVNALFGAYGLVIIDGNTPNLKQLFSPYIKKEITENIAFNKVSKTIDKIKTINKNYSIQVNPRLINLFYLNSESRNRIVEENNNYSVLGTDIMFSKNQLLENLKNHPEHFSPNVILRPVYQEVILPNLCYIGGPGELSYWLELKSLFDSLQVTFPILLPRNSVLFIEEKMQKKIQKIGLSNLQLFQNKNELTHWFLKNYSELPLQLSYQKEQLKVQFQSLYEIAKKTHLTFANLVKAQEIKQTRALNNLEKRLLKAQKKKYNDDLERIFRLKDNLFPNGNLQERVLNFAQIMIQTQGNYIDLLLENLNPLDNRFIIIKQKPLF